MGSLFEQVRVLVAPIHRLAMNVLDHKNRPASVGFVAHFTQLGNIEQNVRDDLKIMNVIGFLDLKVYFCILEFVEFGVFVLLVTQIELDDFLLDFFGFRTEKSICRNVALDKLSELLFAKIFKLGVVQSMSIKDSGFAENQIVLSCKLRMFVSSTFGFFELTKKRFLCLKCNIAILTEAG